MSWENTLTQCFSNGSWDSISCSLSQGFLNIAGTQIIAGLVIVGLFLYASFRLRLPWSFTIPTTIIFIIILTMKYLNAWIGWFILVVALFIAGYGFYKFWKSRG